MKALAAKHGVPVGLQGELRQGEPHEREELPRPGLEAGLAAFEAVKRETGLPCITDVHESWQAEPAGRVVDVLQVPAFLCRQTDLVIACARHGTGGVNVKKGQFVAPRDMRHAVAKCREAGNENVLLTERGATFGYGNLVVDMRGLVQMRELGVPVCLDATHSVQMPGAAPATRRAATAVRRAARARRRGGRDRRALHGDPRGSRARRSPTARTRSTSTWPTGCSRDVLAIRRALGQP